MSNRNSSLAAILADAKQAYAARNPGSRAQHERARGPLPGGNTRSVLHYDPFPLTFAGGKGAWLHDLDGHGYTDFLSEYTAGVAGHSHPAIRAAILRAMEGGLNLGGHNTLEAEFAGVVQARFPSMERLRFTNSGTEANLLAVSVAIAVSATIGSGRRQVMVFPGGYHGAVFVFGPGPNMNVPFDFVYGSYNDTTATMAVIEAHADTLAVVIVEPMLGGGGCIPADPEFLAALRAATARHGIVLIFDEVMTSRLAPGGLQAEHGVLPDMTTLGKYVGGGMSFGAFGGRADIMASLDPSRPGALPHAGTFNNNVLTMSAGFAALTEVYPPQVCVALNQMGDRLRVRLNAAAARHDLALQFTGRGSMLAAHMVRGPIRTPGEAAAGNMAARDLLFFDLVEAGFWIARRGMMSLSVALDESDTERLVDAVDEFAANRGHLLR